MSRLVLGVDPGHSGGAVLLRDGEHVERAWAWRRRSRKAGKIYELRSVGEHSWRIEGEFPRLADAMCWVLGDCPKPYDLVVEGLLPHRKSSAQSLISLGEATGVQVGVFTQGAQRLWRPVASEWRRRLGLGVGRAWSEPHAVAEAEARWGLFSGWDRPRNKSAEALRGHVAEAAWMARFGWLEGPRPERAEEAA